MGKSVYLTGKQASIIEAALHYYARNGHLTNDEEAIEDFHEIKAKLRRVP